MASKNKAAGKLPAAFSYCCKGISSPAAPVLPKPLNPGMESVFEIDLSDDIVTVQPVVTKADKGKRVELTVTPKPDLPPGTHLASLRVTLAVAGTEQLLLVTLPVKMVKY